MKPTNQIFKSNKQTVLQDNSTKDKTLKGLRTIIIQDNEFKVELPNNSILTGTLSYHSSSDGKNNFMTDKGCPFVIGENEIFLNLYQTHNAAYMFYKMTDELDNSSEKTSGSWFKKLFGS
jgi:hypothetical protein